MSTSVLKVPRAMGKSPEATPSTEPDSAGDEEAGHVGARQRQVRARVTRSNGSTGARRTLRSCLVCGVTMAALGGLATAATADPDSTTTPSQAEVDAARQAAQGKARDVAAVQ